jgi:hypothetical protein
LVDAWERERVIRVVFIEISIIHTHVAEPTQIIPAQVRESTLESSNALQTV